jgi:hypothetical protein
MPSILFNMSTVFRILSEFPNNKVIFTDVFFIKAATAFESAETIPPKVKALYPAVLN